MTEPILRRRSLGAKLLYAVVAAALCALMSFAAVYYAGNYAVDKYYMSPEAAAGRKAEIYSRLSAYVSENRVSGRNSELVSRWASSQSYVDIIVYPLRQDELDSRPSHADSIFQLQLASMYGRLYPMHFSDGVYQIAINDRSGEREYAINRISGIVMASMVFVSISLWYSRRITLRIVRLAEEAAEIGAGDLDHPITAGGGDEISMLAAEMDNMRRSVIERMGNERRAWEANSELITAISHDIRTPMTSLIGYLGILSGGSAPEGERSEQLISLAYGKAMELKALTDELFKYFLMFGRADLELNMEELDGRLLLEQLLGEAEFELLDRGFRVQRIAFSGECRLRADPLYLKRVVDNLVSNVSKYADRERNVVILSELSEGRLSVCVSNSVSRSARRVESTKIGLRSCEKIMHQMGGGFSSLRDEEHFSAEFTLPVLPA